MLHQKVTLSNHLLQLAALMRDLCQRQIDKRKLPDNLNLEAIVDGLLREHGLELDFEQQFRACINAMAQDDAVGQTLVLQRHAAELHLHQVAPPQSARCGHRPLRDGAVRRW